MMTRVLNEGLLAAVIADSDWVHWAEAADLSPPRKHGGMAICSASAALTERRDPTDITCLRRPPVPLLELGLLL